MIEKARQDLDTNRQIIGQIRVDDRSRSMHELGMDHFIFEGGGWEITKKKFLHSKSQEKKIMHSGPGKKKIRASLSTGRILLEQIKR